MSVKILNQLSQDFAYLLESAYDYNVVIEVGEQPDIKLFKAHSAILYQRSLYFRQKLTNATKKNDIIELKIPNHFFYVFDIIIRYIYSGVVSLENLEAATIFNLLIALNEFQFTELIDHIQSYLINNNASWLRLKFSRIYQISFENGNFTKLQQFCNDILVKHPNMIFDSEDFITLQENALIALLKRDDLQMEESEIWDKVILWGKARTPDLSYNIEEWTDENFKSLKTTLQRCLPHIRYFQFSSEDVFKKIQPYQTIIEKKIWVDILAKFLSPNMPITSLVLPPRKKAIVQLPLRNVSIRQLPLRNVSTITLSSIITLKHVAEISSWIDKCSTIYSTTKIPYEFKLLLRGSRDGFTGEVFHKLCDNIPNTVVIVKINSTNEILGGYNPLIWKVGSNNLPFRKVGNNSNDHATTADSFIFSLKNKKLSKSILSRVSNASKAIYYSPITHGPGFGCGALGMGNYFDPNPKKWFCQGTTEYVYEKPIRNICEWFLIDEYEVFQICKI
ncbi:hypothetical protein C2G38_2239687 [Gigaspora rosea]|uniref:TLD-domain-containing protein n=1 Tax=Gigaspora rosea TaxID=44941 RepID=A0A397W3L0_9GLOM|nr:hypothetical protein C2G38_2239687 [Gigaspora rosea]